MGISIKRWLTDRIIRSSDRKPLEITCAELEKISKDLRLRELAFSTCVNMIANAVGKCAFKTYRNHKEVEADEFYLWNYEPNTNQNSTAFLHKLIYKLYSENEALVISTKHRDGHEMLAVADTFITPMYFPAKMNEYTGVVVGETAYEKTFRENEVLHFTLNATNVKPVIDGMYQSYNELINQAMQSYAWGNGKHLKVHVNQIAQGDPDFNQNFFDYINNSVKPFLAGGSGVLPEFDGYEYSSMDGTGNTVKSSRNTRDIRAMADDIFTFTANAFGIPPVLLLGDVAGTKDAMTRWLTTCIDPLCDQLQEEITRKRYGLEGWKAGNYLRIDTSTIVHFDMFANAANIEKLIGSGAYSINDVRAAANEGEIKEDWANRHWLTLNISPIENVARATETSEKGGGASEANVGA